MQGHKSARPINSLIVRAFSLIEPTVLLTGLVLSFSMSAYYSYPVIAQKPANQGDNNSVVATSTPTPTSQSFVATTNRSLQNGVYLYGQSAKPEQLQQEYFVFELQNQRVIGAFYMPRSSFDCFRGTLEAGVLNLTITNSYETVAYPYSVALQDYQPVSSVSKNDLRILGSCKTVFQPN